MRTGDPRDSETGATASHRHLARTLPWIVTGLLSVLLVAAHAQYISLGGFHFYDEFRTLDRSAAFATHGDWMTVYSVQEPSFRKPPLQYWMSAGLLEAGVAELPALRLPSLLFAFATLMATALLAAAILPGNLWAMPAAVLLFSGSTMFWEHALSAMLDIGAVFFATLTLAATILALKRPAWWYVAAAAITFGALQKAPVGLFLSGFFLLGLSLTRRWHGLGFRAIRAERAFRIAAMIAVAGAFAWPVLQSLLYGPAAIEELVGQQMVQRFIPTDRVEDIRRGGDVLGLLIGNEALLRWAGIAAIVLLPWRLKRSELLPLPGLFALYALAVTITGGHVTPRYSLVFLPMLAAALACLVLTLPGRGWLAAMVIGALSWGSGGPVRPAASLALDTKGGYVAQIEAFRRVGAQLRPEETLVACFFVGEPRLIPSIASVYGAGGRVFLRPDENGKAFERRIAAGAYDGPLRGLCRPDELERIAERFDDVRIVEHLPQHVIWTASGARHR
ncbi:MAG: ArnT family glycosyltransferase [Tropicimonas sp.]|uniref:ArnT family glycosyltransferase n=1 Tax=Tropicimonas sp. TaxID=2067044 RepID=UPI003A86CE7C